MRGHIESTHIYVNSGGSILGTPVTNSAVTSAGTHLGPYWEGMGWELLEGYRLHCLHCSPCLHCHHCCHCRDRQRVTELEKESSRWSLEDVWDKLNHTTALDVRALFYHMSSCHNNILVTVATDSQLCERAVCSVWHIHTWMLGTDLGAHSRSLQLHSVAKTTREPRLVWKASRIMFESWRSNYTLGTGL